MSRVALCTQDDELSAFFQTLCQRNNLDWVVIGQPGQATQGLGEFDPKLIFLDEAFSGDRTVELITNLISFLPNRKLILLLRNHNFQLLREAMRLGAADVLLIPDELDRLGELFADVLLLSEEASKGTRGRALAFFRAKGGSGATFLAINAAVVATELVKGKVLLIDGNLQTADVTAALNLKGERSIVDLAPVLDELTPQHIADVCAHHPSGLDVLMAPPVPNVGDVLAPEHMAMIVRVAQRAYSAIIVDCPPPTDPRCHAVLRAVNRPLLVTTADSPALFAWRRVSPLVGDLGGRLGMVVNQTTPKIEFNLKEFAEWMQLKMVAEVRQDAPLVQPLANAGQTLLDAKHGRRFMIRPPQIIKQVVRLTNYLLS